jgi:hypothetical protein
VIDKIMKVYTLSTGPSLLSTVFYTTQNLAKKALKKKRDEIMRRCVNVTCDDEDKFSFYFGWEEHSVTWRVNEIEVLEEA